MATPNLPDKSTTAKFPKLLDQVRDKLRGQTLQHPHRNAICQSI